MTGTSAELELILPCYNESRSLRTLVSRVVDAARASGFDSRRFQLILVENGSTDDSFAVLAELATSDLREWIRVVPVIVNRGYGFGLQAGLAAATAEFVAWSHADQQCDPADVFRGYRELRELRERERNPRLLVKGSRVGRNPKDALVSRVFEVLARVILRQPLREINAQPKVFPRALLAEIQNPPNDFAFDLYVLYRAFRSGYRVHSIPVEFPPRVHGVSNWAASFLGRYRTIAKMIGYMITLTWNEVRAAVTPWRLFFAAGLAVKLVCLPAFGSKVLTEYFIPFVDYGVVHPGQNPWSAFPAEFFPYGSALYSLLFVPKLLGYWLFGNAALGTTPLSIGLMKLPILGLDICFLMVLRRIAGVGHQRLIWLYWLNPVLFYISFVHGQLDIAATFFSFLSLFLITERRLRWSAVAMAAAVLSKFHVVILIPFLLAYLWNNNFRLRGISKLSQWIAYFAGATLLGFLPVALADRLGYISAGSPEASRIFAIRLGIGPDQYLYIGFFALACVLGRLCVSTRISTKGLIYGSGVLMGSLILITNSMPGWYFWAIPFLSLFLSCHPGVSRLPFHAFSVLYIVYFVVLPEIPGLTGNALSGGVLFTSLQATFSGTLAYLWMNILTYELPMDLRMRPIRIAIAGGSGAGKNRLSSLITGLFSEENTGVLEGDDYHRWERGSSFWKQRTHLDPQSNHLTTLHNHCERLSRGEAVFQAHYDHRTGKFTNPREIASKKVLLMQGLHALYMTRSGESDLSVFIDPHPAIQLAWAVKRDRVERGHSIDTIVARINARKKDSDQYILPQRAAADCIIEYLPEGEFGTEDALADRQPEFFTRYTLWNQASVLQVVDELSKAPGCKIQIDLSPDVPGKIRLAVHGQPKSGTIEEIARVVFPNLSQIVRSKRPPKWADGYDGLHQIVILTLLQKESQPRHTNHDDADQTSRKSPNRLDATA